MASVFDYYKNLPGFFAEFKDGGLQVRDEEAVPPTESILILGTAIDGPVMEPIAVDPSTVELVFGPGLTPRGTPNGSTVIKAFEEAYQAGCRDIRIMRITGTHATGELEGESYEKSSDKPVTEDLGSAPGNDALELELKHDEIDVDSVIVKADGVALASVDFTVTQGATDQKATVTVKENVANAGAAIEVQYKAKDASKNTKVSGVAVAAEKTYELENTPKAGSFKLYANGSEVQADSYTQTGKNVSLNVSRVKRGDLLEAVFLVEETATKTPVMILKSIFGGQVYNQVKVEVKESGSSKIVAITKPDSKKAQIGEKPLEFNSTDFPTLGSIAVAINESDDNNVLFVEIPKAFEDFETSKLVPTSGVFLDGGSDGIGHSKQEIYEILGGIRDEEGNVVSPGAYQLLENYTVDYIVPTGVYADDQLAGKYDDFANQLALAVAVITHRNHACHGVIATSSPDTSGLADIQEHGEKLLGKRNNFFMRDLAGNILKDEDGRNIDLGRYVSVVAGPDIVFSGQRLGTYAENSPSAYAAFNTTLPPQSSPTNKELTFARSLRYRYSNAQLDKLTQARYVTYKTKNNGAVVAVTDAPTAAQPTSDYRRLTTFKVVKSTVNNIRQVCDPYIGEPNEVAQRNAMSAAVAKELDNAIERGEIVAYTFNVVVTPQMQVMGEAMIELTIVPPQELRRITTVVSLRPAV